MNHSFTRHLLLLLLFCGISLSKLSAQPRPITVTLPSSSVDCNGMVRIPIKVTGFDTLVGIETYILYDSTKLKNISVTNQNTTLGINPSNYNLGNIGKFSFSWTANNPNVGTSLPDGDSILVLNFMIKPGVAGPVIVSFDPQQSTLCIKQVGINNVEVMAVTTGAVILLRDVIPPTITCPPNTSVAAPSGQSTAVFSSQAPTATDNCDNNLAITYTISGATTGSGNGTVSGVTLNAGVSSITYNATDDAGNVAACAFNVTVAASPPPNAIDTLSLQAASITALCADSLQVPITVKAFRGINALAFNLLWDSLKINLTSVTQLNTSLPISINDFNTTVHGRLNFVWNEPANRLDTLPDGAVLFNANFRKIGGGGSAPILFASQNAVGGSPLAAIAPKISNGSVNVTDLTNPTLVCRTDTTIVLPANNASAVVNNLAATAADNCTVRTLTYNLSGATLANGNNNASGQTYNSGVTTVRYTATDLAGNTGTCSFKVTLNNTAPPVFSLQLPTLTANCGDTITMPITVSGFDSIAGVQFTNRWNPTALQFVSVGSFNSSLPIVAANINADTARTNNGRLLFVWNASGTGNTLPNGATLFSIKYVVRAASSVTIDTAASAQPKLQVIRGSNTIATQVTQGNVNTSDNTAPTISCPASVTANTDVGSNAAIINNINAVANDNCGTPTISYSFVGATTGNGNGTASGKSYNFGQTTVTYRATDASGNSTTCSFKVTVIKSIQDFTLAIGDTSGRCGDTVCVPVRVFNYNGILSLQFTVKWNPAQLQYAGVGNLNTQLPADATNIGDIFSLTSAGKLTYSRFTTNTAAGDTLADNSTLFCVKLKLLGNAASVSNVQFDVSNTAPAFVEATKGNPAVVLPFLLKNGKINLIDNTPPTIVCPANVTVNVFSGLTNSVVNNIAPNVADNCGVKLVQYSLSGVTNKLGLNDASGNIFNIGTTQVRYLATDFNGNTALCTFTVTVNNTQTNTNLSIVFDNATASCGGGNVQICAKVYNFNAIAGLQYAVTWDTTKLKFISIANQNTAAGVSTTNSNFGVFDGIITFVLNNNPGITLPDGTTLYCLNFKPVGAVGSNPTLSQTQNRTPLEASLDDGTIVLPVNFYNSTIQIIDNTPPTIVCPTDKTVKVKIGQSNTEVTGLTPTVADACAIGNYEYILSGATTGSGPGDASGETFNVGTTAVRYVVYDKDGNSATCAFNVTVKQLPSTKFSLIAETAPANCSDTLYAVNIRVLNADSLSSLQFVILWNTAVLTYSTVGNINPLLSGNDVTFGTNAANGNLGFSWAQAQGQSVNFPDSAILFTIFYNVNGLAGSSTLVRFDTSALASPFIEAVAGAANKVLPYDVFNGSATVFDTEAPKIICPSDVRQVPTLVNNIAATATDNCELKPLQYTLTGATNASGTPNASGLNFNQGNTTVTYIATDFGGNTVTCSFTVTIAPDTVRLFVQSDTINMCGDTARLDVTAVDFTALDSLRFNLNWNGIALSFLGATNLNPAFAQSDFSNISANKFTFAHFGNGVTIPQNARLFTALFLVKNSKPSNITFDSTFAKTGSSNVFVKVSNGKVNSQDTTKPTIACPINQFVMSDAGICGKNVTFLLPTFADNCADSIKLTSNIPTGSFIRAGRLTAVIYTVTDASGNTQTCSFNVLVQDTQAPVITNCPRDTVVQASTGQCKASVCWVAPTASDNCGAVLSFTSDFRPCDTFPSGITLVSYEARDSSNVLGVCTFKVTVLGGQGPKFQNCPSAIVVSSKANICGDSVYWNIPTVMGGCGSTNAQTIFTDIPGDYFPVGKDTVTYITFDAQGRRDTCSFTVTVIDSIKPVIVGCPADIIRILPPDVCLAKAAWTPPTATDNCKVKLTSNHNSGELFSAGTTLVVYEATDSVSSVFCTFKVILRDTVKPFVPCPQNIVVPADLGQCNALVSWSAVVGTDNCDTSLVTIPTVPNGSTFSIGTTTVVYTSTDDSGNTATCSFTVRVRDTQKPVFQGCPRDTSYVAAAGSCTVTASWNLPFPTDNCNITQVVVGNNGYFPGATLTASTTPYVIFYTARDSSGNVDTCRFKVLVVGGAPPTITNCPPDVSFGTDATQPGCGRIVGWQVPTGTSGCGGGVGSVRFTSVPAQNSFFGLGTATVTYTATDTLTGQTSTCTFKVTINDDDKPTLLNCPSDTIFAFAGFNCSAVASWIAPTATDNCSTTTTLTSNFAPGSSFGLGATRVIYKAKDDFNNMDSCRFIVFVRDTTPPVISGCPSNITVNAAANGNTTVTWTPPTVFDNCDTSVLFVATNTPGQTFSCGTSIVSYVARDDYNNTTICSFNVVVVDTIKPVFTGCPKDTSIVLTNGGCTTLYSWIKPQATDNCSVGLVPTANHQPGEAFAAGTTTVVNYLVADTYGNTQTCVFTIKVSENVPPKIDCPKGIEVSLDTRIFKDTTGIITSVLRGTNCSNVRINFIVPKATDNCALDTTLQTGASGLTSGSLFPTGNTVLIYTATDKNGNSTTCVFTVNVLPLMPPNVTASQMEVCQGGVLQLSADSIPGATYQWSGPLGFTSTQRKPVVSPVALKDAGLYFVSVSIDSCMTGLSDTLIISVLGPPSLGNDNIEVNAKDSVRFNPFINDQVNLGKNITITIAPNVLHGKLRMDNDTAFIYTPFGDYIGPDMFSYKVCYEDCPDLCATGIVIINVVPGEGCKVPNIITPNGDGYNDLLVMDCLRPDGSKVESNIMIFNEWGDKVYEAAPYLNDWGGTYKGQPLPDGAYYYIFRENPSKTPLKGYIMIFR